jgi:two-component system, LytTR family, sensor kinase
MLNEGKKVEIRWRQQELTFITIIFLFTLNKYIWQAFSLTAEEINERFHQVYAQYQMPFNYFINVFFPKIGSLILLYGIYMQVNFVVRPMGRIYESKRLSTILFRILIGIGLFAATSALVAVGVAVATDYSSPWLFNYGPEFNVLAFFGNRPNLIMAFNHAFAFMTIYGAYAYLREATIWLLQKRGDKNAYSILVTNQVTAIVLIYFLIAWIIKTNDVFGNISLASDLYSIITPILLLSLTNIYWLFPRMQEGSSIFQRPTIIRLLISGLLCSIPFLLFPVADKKLLIFLFFWIGLICIVTPLSWLYFRQRKDKILQLRSMQQALARSETDLKFLRSQVNPHFLFNTLNTIYGLALQEGGTKTAEGVQKLGDMMRFMLHENNQSLIPIEKEVDYLENYISLQKLRIQSSENIDISANIDTVNCGHSIPPMLLIPFVENAFKYGISLVKPSWIKIGLKCNSGELLFKVTNSVHPQQAKESTGIGIPNVAERLKHIYPGKHRLIHKQEGDQFIVELTIQF